MNKRTILMALSGIGVIVCAYATHNSVMAGDPGMALLMVVCMAINWRTFFRSLE